MIGRRSLHTMRSRSLQRLPSLDLQVEGSQAARQSKLTTLLGMFQFWFLGVLVHCFTHFETLPIMSHQCQLEQRSVIKFLVKQGATPIQCWHQLEAVYGAEQALGKTQTRAWHKKFREGDLDTVIKDQPRSGCGRSGHSQTNINVIQTQVNQDRRQSVRQISAETGISRSSVQRILRKDLRLHPVSAKFMPRILTDEQKQFRLQICQQHLDQFNQEGIGFLQRIVTGDESSLPTFAPETKIRTAQWIPRNERHPRKALRSRTRRSTMITTFFDCNGLIHTEFVPQGETVTADAYCATLGRLREQIRHKRPHLWVKNGDWRHYLFHHDNAMPHTAVPTLAMLGETGTDMLAHPPYSPDLTPNDYFLYPELKRHMRGVVYRSVQEVQQAALRILHQIPQDKFEDAIKDLPVRWAKCVASGGDFFEGDGIEIPDFMVEVSGSEESSHEEQ